MTIVLSEEIVNRKDLIGDDEFQLTAGQKLKVEAPGMDILDATVPSGKVWNVHVAVVITETDA